MIVYVRHDCGLFLNSLGSTLRTIKQCHFYFCTSNVVDKHTPFVCLQWCEITIIIILAGKRIVNIDFAYKCLFGANALLYKHKREFNAMKNANYFRNKSSFTIVRLVRTLALYS